MKTIRFPAIVRWLEADYRRAEYQKQQQLRIAKARRKART